MFYAAVVPLLPTLTRQLHLSKASAGVLTASYALGTLVGSMPGGRLASRAGPRTAVYVGLLLMACSSVAFGFLDNIALLDAARFVQGVGGAYTWAGSLAWLIDAVPVDRRGSTIGGALAAAIGGALFGPVIGTLAHLLGRAPVFSAVVVVAGALAAIVRLLPAPPPPSSEPRRTRLLDEIREPAIALSLWLVALPAIASGVINVLAPLRLSALGAQRDRHRRNVPDRGRAGGGRQPCRRPRIGPSRPAAPAARRARGVRGRTSAVHAAEERRRGGRDRRARGGGARELLGAGDGDDLGCRRVPRRSPGLRDGARRTSRGRRARSSAPAAAARWPRSRVTECRSRSPRPCACSRSR